MCGYCGWMNKVSVAVLLRSAWLDGSDQCNWVTEISIPASVSVGG